MFAAVTGRSVVVGCILLLFVGTNAYADGTYQRTRDGKTLVWNQDPKPTDRATWSGDRDQDGYASGFGTLTWYTAKSQGDNDSKATIYARYFGNMIRGKFDGPVNGHSKGVTGHAVFSDGKRLSRWAAGPVPSWNMPRSLPSPPAAATPKEAAKINEPSFNPPPPSYGVAALGRPVPDLDYLPEQSATDIPEEGPAEATTANPTSRSGPAPKPKLGIDESLRLLVGPPPPARAISGDSPVRPKNPRRGANPNPARLTQEEVIRLADSEARRRGYDLNEYQRSGAQFDPADNTWSLLYEQKAGSNMAGSPKRFTMAIDEKTGRTAVVPGR